MNFKKFVTWLSGKPYIIYVGQDKYEVRVRCGIFTCSVDRDDRRLWLDSKARKSYCRCTSMEEADHLRFDFAMIGKLMT